jgi:EpsI family protein
MRRLSSWQRMLPLIVLLAATVLGLQARGYQEILPSYQHLATFPKQIGDWRARDLSLTPDELDILGPGEFLLRDYLRRADELSVNLFIAFFPSQRTGDTIHSPQNCLPGSGWTSLESVRIPVRRRDGTTISINRYVVARGADRDLVFYWYQAHGRVTPSEYWAKIFLVTDAIRMNRTDGALIRVTIPIREPGGEGAAESEALTFVHQILPLLEAYIPR